MIEYLGASRAEDRVLHGLARVLNVLVALVLMPVWLFGQRLLMPVVRVISRCVYSPRDNRSRQRYEYPRYGYECSGSGAHTGRARDGRPLNMDALKDELERIPQRPRRLGRHATAVKGLPDLALFVLSQRRETATFGYAYPSQFENRVIGGADGQPIAAEVALHPQPRPGLIVVHGMFSSRLFDYVRQIAVAAFFNWGFNVAVVDLRGFGLSGILSEAPTTAGWKEGHDILATAAYLRENGCTSVGAMGISLGGSSVMGACHLEGAEHALDGGVLAVCGPADTRVAVEHLSRSLPRFHPFKIDQYMFKRMLRSKQKSMRWPIVSEDFRDPVRLYIAPFYGISEDEFYELSSAKNHIANARVPVLVLHAEDDHVVPPEHAHILSRAGRENPNVAVWILPWGGHAAFDVLDRRWASAVYRRYFENWARYPSGGDGAQTSIGERAEAKTPTREGEGAYASPGGGDGAYASPGEGERARASSDMRPPTVVYSGSSKGADRRQLGQKASEDL